jgi:protein phosphatase
MLRAADAIAKTDTGRQRRDNEDCALARAPVFVVADGMGGAQAGEVASKIAIETFEQGLPDEGSPEERLSRRVQEANRTIHDLSRAEHERAGMGTTLTAAFLVDSNLAIAHVGDSRAYLYRDGTLKRLTQDHSLVGELVRRGKLTEAQAEEHPQRSIITRALGPEPSVEVDTWTYPVRAGDVLLLCSDGLTSMVGEDRIAELLGSSGSLGETAQALIDEANAAGGRDNITVVLFRVEEVGGDSQPPDQPTTLQIADPQPNAPAPPTEVPSAGAPAPAPPMQATATATRPSEVPPEGALQSRARPQPRTPRATHIPRAPQAPPRRRRARFAKPVAALLATLIVLVLIGAGGYLASRQLFFVGTNSQGIVTIYRGLPFDLPVGIKLYETFYVSGVPASLVPQDRRAAIFDNKLRSQSDADRLVRDLELGKVVK